MSKFSRRLVTLLPLVLFICLPAHAQTGSRQFVTTVVANDVGVGNIGSGIAYHQLSWNPLGTVSTCSVKLQSSVDNITYVDLITSQTCTAPGQSTVVNSVVNYIKIEVTVISGGGSVTILWNGFNTNPSGGGFTPTGAGAAPDIAIFSGATTLTGSAALTSPAAGSINQNINGLTSNLRTDSDTVGGGFITENLSLAEGRYTLTAFDPTFSFSSFLVLSGSGAIPFELSGNNGAAKIQSASGGAITLDAGILLDQPISLLGSIVTNNCSSAAGACNIGGVTGATSGAVSIAAGATTVVVADTKVTVNSNILVTADSSNSTRLGVTCNTTVPAVYSVTARVPGVSFTITATAPIANPACFDYMMVN